MPRPANPKTPEGSVITRAIPASGLNQAALAEALDVTPGFISQFASGLRPVPWDKADQLSALLSLSPEDISAEYRRIKDHFGVSATGRMTADVVAAAIALAKELSGHEGKSGFDIESNPDVFATAVNRILAAAESHQLSTKDGKGSGHASLGADASSGPGPAAGRAKKRG